VNGIDLMMITTLRILEEIGGSEAEEIIRYALQSSDNDIARQAAKPLERLSLHHQICT